jgi:hypothetical protein
MEYGSMGVLSGKYGSMGVLSRKYGEDSTLLPTPYSLFSEIDSIPERRKT